MVSCDDQAAGLRRLFGQSPPSVAAVYASGRHAEASILRLAHRLAGRSQTVLLLDEMPDFGTAASAAQGLDLLHALDGRVDLATLQQSLGDDVVRVPVGFAAQAFALLDAPRRERLLGLLRELCRRAGFVLVRAAAARRPSPFVWASPRRLLLAEASRNGATGAYEKIKDVAAAGAGCLQVAVAGARSREEAARFFAGLEALVRRHVGLPLAWLGEVERDDLASSLGLPAPSASARQAEEVFLRRLQIWTREANKAKGVA